MVVDFPKRVVHGGTGKREQEKTCKKVLDFSASTNPWPPQFAWSVGEDALGRYPDDTYAALKERIGEVFRRDPHEICVGNGSVELIRVFCSVVFRDRSVRDTFFCPSPTFGEYELSARLAGAARTPDPAKAGVAFLCNPNNPDGALTPGRRIREMAESAQRRGSLVFCDEAFIELADPRESAADLRDPGLFVLRSLTKSFSVPGIRFGYGFGDPDLIEKIETARSPWTVNAYAEAYAMEALLHLDALEASRSAIREERRWLAGKLGRLGLICHLSQANYILANYGKDVSSLCETLAGQGILVRDCTSFGLPSCIRVAVRTREENRILIGALEACVR